MIAQTAEIRPPELYDSPAPETETGLAESREQSGQSHWRVSEKGFGRTERHVTCHGVAHVLHVRDSSAVGLFFVVVLASHANAFTFTRRVVKLVEPFGLLSVRLDFGEYYVS